MLPFEVLGTSRVALSGREPSNVLQNRQNVMFSWLALSCFSTETLSRRIKPVEIWLVAADRGVCYKVVQIPVITTISKTYSRSSRSFTATVFISTLGPHIHSLPS